MIGDSAKLVHVARSRGLLWNLSDAESFVADVACKETAFLELMKHNFPDIYAQIRAPVDPSHSGAAPHTNCCRAKCVAP